MNIFEDFKEFGIFTIIFLAVALVGGALALIKKQQSKRIMLFNGIAEAATLAAALITFAVKGNSFAVFAVLSVGGFLAGFRVRVRNCPVLVPV